MDELYEMLKKKLQTMRSEQECHIMFDFGEVAQLFQLICLMKQIKDITKWIDKED